MRCTNQMVLNGATFQCTHEATDVWELHNGIIVSARCERCLQERASVVVGKKGSRSAQLFINDADQDFEEVTT